MNGFFINRKLPSLNEWWYAIARNKYIGSKFKQDVEEAIMWDIRQALNAKALRKPKTPVIVRFEWHERTNKRDADNIASAKKYILDALVKMRVLENDSRKYVIGFYDVIVDDKTDFVIVELIEKEQIC